MGFVLSNTAIDKYFGFLTKLDNRSKKKLIVKLTESIEDNEDKTFDFSSLYGAWEDSRSSDEIIKEIKDSRVDKNDPNCFLMKYYGSSCSLVCTHNQYSELSCEP